MIQNHATSNHNNKSKRFPCNWRQFSVPFLCTLPIIRPLRFFGRTLLRFFRTTLALIFRTTQKWRFAPVSRTRNKNFALISRTIRKRSAPVSRTFRERFAPVSRTIQGKDVCRSDVWPGKDSRTDCLVSRSRLIGSGANGKIYRSEALVVVKGLCDCGRADEKHATREDPC